MDGNNQRMASRRFSDVLRAKAITLLVVLSVMQWGYLLIRVPTLAEYDAAIEAMTSDLAMLRTEHKLDEQEFASRIERLESYVFGTIQKAVDDKKRPITSAEAWQRNRDANIAKRLSALEDWRQRTEER